MSENLEGNPLILFSSPQALLKIASFKLALICWCQEFNNIHIFSDLSIHAPEFNAGDVLRRSLPNHISEIINHHIKLVSSHLVSWIDVHKSCIFQAHRINIVLECFDCIVYRSDGKICYPSTARNLLMSDALNLEEKYRIACVYCFKEDIDSLWLSVMDNISASDCSIFVQYKDQFPEAYQFLAVNYWSRVKRNEHSVGVDLLQCDDMHLLAKMKFYWDMFSFPEPFELQFVAEICSNGKVCNHDVIKFMMSRLDVTEQAHLLTLAPWPLIFFLAVEDVESCNCSLQVWNHVKDTITNDQFFTILHHLWHSVFCVSTKCTGYVDVILREIWITAPQHLREYILNNHVAVFFNDLRVPCDMLNYGQDMEFYIDMLSNLSPDLRHQLWIENWHKFICLATVPVLDKLMELCFIEQNDVISFKHDFMVDDITLREEFTSFIRAGLFEELSNYLMFCCTEDTIHYHREQILRLSLNASFLFQQPKLNFNWNRCVKFNEFINNSFREVSLIDQFKAQFISNHFGRLDAVLCIGENLDVLRNLVMCLVSSNKINMLKQTAYVFCENSLRAGCFINFDARQWQSFLKWCAPSEDEFLQFKETLPLDDIFGTYLGRVIEGQKELRSHYLNTTVIDFNRALFPNYVSFTNFLRWYFGSDEAANNFKYNMIHNYTNIEAIKVVLQQENIDIVIGMLKWFFNHDMNQVMTFFSSFIKTKL